MMEMIGEYKGEPVFLDYEPDKAPLPWAIWCLRDPGSIIRRNFPTEGEAKAYAAGRYHLPVEQCSADPDANWPDVKDWHKRRIGMYYPDNRSGFWIFTIPDGRWTAARGNRGFLFDTKGEALAFAAGRNWCGIKWYRNTREQDGCRE